MIENKINFLDYETRLDAVMALAWSIFKAQFINERNFIRTEAPFQYHFADIIKQVGNLHCFTRKDIFLVDLETQCKNIKGKTKYVDITCQFVDQINCAIELKFKKESSPYDHGRIDIYVDIEALELVCNDTFNVGKFYAITNSKPYVNPSKVGVGTVFPTHDGHVTEANKSLWANCEGRKHITVNLKNSYTFNWEKINEWYFLELTVRQKNVN